MIGLSIRLNEEEPRLAGFAGQGTVCADILMAAPYQSAEGSLPCARVHGFAIRRGRILGGAEWVDLRVRAGDVIEVRVRQMDAADAPKRMYGGGPQETLTDHRAGLRRAMKGLAEAEARLAAEAGPKPRGKTTPARTYAVGEGPLGLRVLVNEREVCLAGLPGENAAVFALVHLERLRGTRLRVRVWGHTGPYATPIHWFLHNFAADTVVRVEVAALTRVSAAGPLRDTSTRERIRHLRNEIARHERAIAGLTARAATSAGTRRRPRAPDR